MLVLAAVHVYLAIEHVGPVMSGSIEWTNWWKGLGALGGAYIFVALASRAEWGPRAKEDVSSAPDATR
jgi:hypothetical protein